jgi:GGDEF domain-containing protein
MTSIKRFLDRHSGPPAAERDLLEASLLLRVLLQQGIAARSDGRDAATLGFEATSRDLLHRLEEATTPVELVGIANQSLQAVESHRQRTTEALREQSSQMQSMVTMLTDTLAAISGRSNASVTQLQSIERQIEGACGLGDIRALRKSLETCLATVREAAVEEKKATLATVERLSDHIKRVPQLPVAIVPEGSGVGPGTDNPEYVAAFKVQRADHILARFGESACDQMLTLIGEGLKSAQGPTDRLMRWKGPAFVMFLSSSENVMAIRRRLLATVRKIGQGHIELEKNAALLAVGVDWIVYPQSEYASLDAVYAQVDSFVRGAAQVKAAGGNTI